MRRLLLFLLITAPALASPAVGAADGADLFANFCQGCHGEQAAGLRQISVTRERFQTILEGETEDMPDFYGMFEPDDVAALYEFITRPDDT